MKEFALLMVLFFAEGVENPRPQFLPGYYPMVIDAADCERALTKFNETLAAANATADESGQVFPLYRVTCDPIDPPETK